MESPVSTIELNPAGPVTACVIWMHGLGADGNDFVPMIPELGLPESAGVRFVFPNAPMRSVTINGGAHMRAWYDIAMADLERRADEKGIRESQVQCGQLIAREMQRGVPSERIVLAGFSQGGVIALQTGLRYPARLGGVLALSTYLACTDSLLTEASASNRAIPIYYAHGAQDAVIPMSLAEQSVASLKQAGYAVDFQKYSMQHAVCREEIVHIAQSLRRMLAIA